MGRFTGDLPADPRHILVNVNPRTLEFPAISHDDTLGVVGGEGGDDIARCHLVFPIPPDPVGTHDIMGGYLNVEFRLRQLSNNSVGLFAGFLWYSTNPNDVSAGILLQFIALSSSSLTLVFSALISEFFLAISTSNLPVIVLASPRSSCAGCSVVSWPVTSSDVIAASSASISIVDWLDGQYGMVSWA